MEALWNQINLRRPPFRSWDVSIEELNPKKFIENIERILRDFKNLEILHAEAALLSRLIYRMKSKFRSDKGLKHMEKVNRALLNYLNMSLEREYKLLKEYIEVNNGVVSFPPKQTLEYVLVRTQGFAKLMCRVESTAKIAANFLKSRLQIGQAWPVALISYAVISRIWIMSRNIIKTACTWYDSIFKYTKTFKIVGIPWLPDNYILPKKLLPWLDVSWINEDLEKLPEIDNFQKSIFDFIKTNNEVEEIKNDDNFEEKFISEKDNTKKTASDLSKSISKEDIDFGEQISRDQFIESNNTSCIEAEIKKKKKKKVKNKQNNEPKISEITCEKDLIKLLQTESCSGYDKLQWSLLKKRIKKLLVKLTKNNTVNVDSKLCKKVTRYIKKWTNGT